MRSLFNTAAEGASSFNLALLRRGYDTVHKKIYKIKMGPLCLENCVSPCLLLYGVVNKESERWKRISIADPCISFSNQDIVLVFIYYYLI